MSKGKPPFAPIPLRALLDDRLTLTHLRALGIIGYHDRMSLVSGKGQGCWASSKTMALEIGANVSNISAAINQLSSWGYIEIGTLAVDKRKRVYRVVFDDGEARDRLPTNKQSDGDRLPTGKEPDDDRLLVDELTGEIVCPQNEKTGHFQSAVEGNIFRKAGETYSVETGKNIQQKLAPLSRRRQNFDDELRPASADEAIETLAALRHVMAKRPSVLGADDIKKWRRWLILAASEFPDGDPMRRELSFAEFDLNELVAGRSAKLQ